MNRNTFRLASLLTMALGLTGAGPGSCGPTDPELCVGLDEQTCVQTDGCEPVYYQLQCGCAPCAQDGFCPPCECGAPEFASCSAERPEPPPAERCAGLEEWACMVEPGCAPTYFAAEPGVRCAADRCLGGYAGCVEAIEPDSCANLDEASCVANPKCEAIYGDPSVAGGIDDNGDGFIDDTRCLGGGVDSDGNAVRCLSSFVGCRDAQQICPAVACMMYCEFGMARDANGCEICACNTTCSSDADCGPGERCDAPVINCIPEEPCPTVVGLCVPAQRECRTDADCAAGERCEAGLMDCAEGQDCVGAYGLCVPDQVCPPFLCPLWCENGFARDQNGCQTCECAPANCMADSDCAAGESCDPTTGLCRPADRRCTADSQCAPGEQCLFPEIACAADGLCPDPIGTCVATGCEPVACDLWCETGFARDERGCEICACQPAGCSSNADCAEGEVCEVDAYACPPGAVGCFNPGVCKPAPVDPTCQYDSDCTAGTVCRPDPTDPCSSAGVYCLQPPRGICQAPCAGLDEAGCVARRDCSATYVQGGGWCGNEMVFAGCSDS